MCRRGSWNLRDRTAEERPRLPAAPCPRGRRAAPTRSDHRRGSHIGARQRPCVDPDAPLTQPGAGVSPSPALANSGQTVAAQCRRRDAAGLRSQRLPSVVRWGSTPPYARPSDCLMIRCEDESGRARGCSTSQSLPGMVRNAGASRLLRLQCPQTGGRQIRPAHWNSLASTCGLPSVVRWG